MKKLHIDLEAITEFHEPHPYKFYPAIRIDCYECDESGAIRSLMTHRCEDIHGSVGYDIQAEAIETARLYLQNNYRNIVQAIVSEIGE